MTSVTVIIVNYNGGEHPKAALRSLAAQTCRDFEVILVDNASSDGSADNLPTEGLPKFELILSPENLGFAGGNNLAARQAKGRWLALLNPDAIAAPDWLERLLAAEERHPGVAMFASAQYSASDEALLDGAGDAYLIFGMPWRGGYSRSVSEMPTQEGTCFSPCGAGAFFLRETFLEHGGFDERFFCFCEDVDIGFRLRLAGHDCIFLPDAVIHHHGGHSSDKISDFALLHGGRNRIWTYVKNMPTLLLLLTLPGHVALSIYLLIRAAMTGKGVATFQAMRAGVAGLPELLSDGRWRVKYRKVGLWRLARDMAWNPWVMSGRHVHVRPLPERLKAPR